MNQDQDQDQDQLQQQEQELIRNVEDYDPSKPNNAQLADDMRIVFAWYSSLCEGKQLKFSKDQVIELARKIYQEIEKRKREGKMRHEWQPDKMKPHSRELFEIISGARSSSSSSSPSSTKSELYIPFDTLPIFPGGVSEEFEPLDYQAFISKWNSFLLRKPFIYLVGSLANWQHTTGDIDILVKARDPTPLLNALDRAINSCFERGDAQLADLLIQVRQFIHSDSLFLLTRWRIVRAFPEYKDRLHILDDSFSGPFTNFVELSDLAAVARSEPIRQQMSGSGIKLFQWFPMLKPMHGRHKGEIYSVDSVIEVLKSRKEDWFDIGIYVQKKYDGTHCQVHKGGDKVFIYTEDGTDVTNNCPTLVQEFRQQPFHSFILCGEIELWKDGKHQPRAITAGILNASKPQPDEKHLRFNVYDCVFFDSVGDIHNRPYSERIKFYQKIHETEHIKLAPFTLCHDEQCVREAIKKYSAAEGSEGAYLKRADFPYELDGKTRLNLKYKKERSLDALVLKRKKVAGTDHTFYYICGLKGDDSKPVYCGKTFNTNIKAEPGDIIKVVFVDISGYTDPKTKKRWVNWWAPRVVMLRTDKKEPDNIETAWRMVKQTTGRFEEKPMPDIEHLEELASSDADAHTHEKRFVIQNHFRGSSSHGDFRVQLNHVLGGFTLGWQRADELEKELDKHWELKKTADRYEIYWDGQLFYALDKRERVIKEPPVALKRRVFAFHKKLAFDPKYWKVDMQTGEALSREGSTGTADKVEKIFCVQKTREPYEWLSMEGITAPREIEPEPGGTRFFPGIFVEVDSGTYFPGAQKPYFKEYFLNGKKWKGRVVFRLVAGLKGTKAVANWLYWKPDDQTPYVLSARAVRDNWLPTEGSAMPPEWEQKLPEELHFWKATTRKQKLKLRALARKYLIDSRRLVAVNSSSEKQDEAEGTEFILTHRYWQGQLVIRGLPVEDYHIRIGDYRFHLDKDPTHKFPEQGISALQFSDRDEFFVEGRKKPQSPVNPNRKIPAFISVLDRGKAEIIADQPLYLHVRLSGKKLKGLFYFRRTSRASEFWTFKKGMESF